jgi:hypothetical protein
MAVQLAAREAIVLKRPAPLVDNIYEKLGLPRPPSIQPSQYELSENGRSREANLQLDRADALEALAGLLDLENHRIARIGQVTNEGLRDHKLEKVVPYCEVPSSVREQESLLDRIKATWHTVEWTLRPEYRHEMKQLAQLVIQMRMEILGEAEKFRKATVGAAAHPSEMRVFKELNDAATNFCQLSGSLVALNEFQNTRHLVKAGCQWLAFEDQMRRLGSTPR